MTRLISEKRMDRNGKLVTRHVKPVDDSSAKAAGIPAPSMAPQPVLTPLEKVDNLWREKVDHEGINGVAEADGHRSAYLDRKGVALQAQLTKALTEAESPEERDAIVAVLDEQLPAPTAQLIFNNIQFFTRFAAGCRRETDSQPYERAIYAFDHVTSNIFKTSRSREAEKVTDYTKNADMARAAAMSRFLDTNNAMSLFDQMDEYREIVEHQDLLLKHLNSCKQVLSAGRDDPSAYDAIAIAELLDDNPGSEDAIVSIVVERKRIDLAEIREAINTHSSLSAGAI